MVLFPDLAAIALVLAVEKIGLLLALRGAARERRELYGRLQAGTLRDYAASVPATRTSGKLRGADPRQVPSGPSVSAYLSEVTSDDFVEAQAAFRSVME